MSVRQYEEERQQREQFLKKENEALNRHKGELIDKVWALESENKRLHRMVETLSIIASFEVLDGKDRYYYQNIALNAVLGARKALEGEQHGPSTD